MGGRAGRRTVHVVGLGGTIAMRVDGDAGGATPTLTAQGLLDAVPGLADVADVVTHSLRNLPSASLEVADVRAFVREAQRACAAGADGVVASQGTDTLEETAYLVDLLWARPEPIVLTGAMRPADAVGADGPANLESAVRTAASPDARGRGCLVVMNDEVHTARAVRKTHTTSPAAFASPATGPVGRVQEGAVRLPAAGPRRRPVEVADDAAVPAVGLLRAALGADDRMVRWAAATYDGLVVEAMGGGHLPHWWVEPMAEAARRIPVLLASRTGSGAILGQTYAFAGAERGLLAAGLLSAGDLDGLKSRILLTAALMASADRARVAEIVRHHTDTAVSSIETLPYEEEVAR